MALQQQITKPDHGGQKIIEIVRDAACEPADGAPRLLCFRRQEPLAALVIRLFVFARDKPDLVGLMTTEVAWPPAAARLLRDGFDLTSSETEVLKELTLGQSVKDIAAASGRSEPTIRTHIRSIFLKTKTSSLMELIRMTLGVLQIAAPHQAAPVANRTGPFETLLLKDRRRLDYLVIGAANGAPFLLLPGGVGTTPFPPRLEQELYARHLKMIVPIRAGFGRSSPLPHGRHVHEVTASDTFELMDRLGIAKAPFVTICDDFRLAVALALAKPQRMTAILACGAPMPAATAEHFARMAKWRRFVSANARYAPGALPYLALTYFSLVRRLGPKRFMQTVMADSPADLRAIDDGEVMATIARGSEIAISPGVSAHSAWAAEVAAHWSVDWSEDLRNCQVPITLFAGHQDPFSPIETVKEFAAEIPNIRLFDFPDCGQLLYPYASSLIDAIEASIDGR